MECLELATHAECRETQLQSRFQNGEENGGVRVLNLGGQVDVLANASTLTTSLVTVQHWVSILFGQLGGLIRNKLFRQAGSSSAPGWHCYLFDVM